MKRKVNKIGSVLKELIVARKGGKVHKEKTVDY